MKQQLTENQDPFGFDIFLSIELFEETLSTLADLYFQLWFREQRKPATEQEPELATRYLSRHRDLRSQRHHFRIDQVSERDNATQLYAQELRDLRSRHFINQVFQ